MLKWILVVVLLLACLPALSAAPLSESLELSLIGGTTGWGVGAYWPVESWKDLTAGPFFAIGSKEVAAGLSVKFENPIPVLDQIFNWVGAGLQVDTEQINRGFTLEDINPGFWVGKTIEFTP